MPWNFPFWQVFRFAAPALMAGNVGLLKHASNVPQCALAIEDIFRRARAPRRRVPDAADPLVRDVALLLDDPRVSAVTLTGSEAAGPRRGEPRRARRSRRRVLELGGSDPFIVMPSADVAKAAAHRGHGAHRSTTVSPASPPSASSCRRLSPTSSLRRFVAAMSALRVGDPMDASTDVGPLATPDLVADLEAQVRATVAAGARVLIGRHAARRAGQLLSLRPCSSTSRRDRRRTARSSSGPWPRCSASRSARRSDRARQRHRRSGSARASGRKTPRSASASCASSKPVRSSSTRWWSSDPRLPFGGVKRSGYGRELGVHGIREFVNVKTVWVSA